MNEMTAAQWLGGGRKINIYIKNEWKAKEAHQNQ